MIKLQVEEYCQNCPDFEPDIFKQHETLYADNMPIVDPLCYVQPETRHICETTVECKYKKRCAAQIRYLQKQYTEEQEKIQAAAKKLVGR